MRPSSPAFTIEFITSSQDVNQNKFTTAFVKADGAKNILDMKVVFPLDKHAEMAKQIADESLARFKTKLKAAGFEVVEWSEVKKMSKDAQEFETEKLKLETFKNQDNSVSVAANGLGRLDSIFWNASAASTVRDTKIAIVVPHFTIGYGYFGGKETPKTIKETHDTTSLMFTPQLQVYTGSGIKTSGKYEGGSIALAKTAAFDEQFYKSFAKANDSRGLAKEREEDMRAVGAGLHNTESKNIVVSSRAGVDYEMSIEPTKYKAAVMKQLDLVENMVIERYKAEL